MGLAFLAIYCYEFIIENKEKITDTILAIAAFIWVIFISWLCFHGCEGCDNRHNNPEHIHFERHF